MSNDNEIYPLKEFIEGDGPLDRQRSVNQRLAPIYKALLDDPEGWEYEAFDEGDGWEKVNPHAWWNCLLLPGQQRVENFRLVRKRKTISVEIDKPVNSGHGVYIANMPDHTAELRLPYENYGQAKAAFNKIRSAMEGN